MLIVISPAKTLDFSRSSLAVDHTMPEFLKESKILIEKLRKLNPEDISDLMNVSRSISWLNYERFMEWKLPFTKENSKEALFAFKADVYRSMKATDFSSEDLTFAQEHLRILSGLYGVLKPLDLIQAYRLEMGTRISVALFKNLYQFWGEKITKNISKQLKKLKSHTLINLASAEYFKSVKLSRLNAEVITPEFREERNDKYQIISIYAKIARGSMTRFIIKNKITDPQQIKLFDEDGYQFNNHLSDEFNWIFTR